MKQIKVDESWSSYINSHPRYALDQSDYNITMRREQDEFNNLIAFWLIPYRICVSMLQKKLMKQPWYCYLSFFHKRRKANQKDFIHFVSCLHDFNFLKLMGARKPQTCQKVSTRSHRKMTTQKLRRRKKGEKLKKNQNGWQAFRELVMHLYFKYWEFVIELYILK